MITEAGVHVYPRLPKTARERPPARHLKRRLSTGVSGLDAMMGGGIPEGDSLMVTGPTGSGKTILATQFISDGTRRGECAVIAVFEEHPEMYVARAKQRGSDGARVTAEVVERGIEAALPPSVATLVTGLLRDADGTGALRSEIEVERDGERGTPRWWRITILPILGESPNDFVLQVADITSEVADRHHVRQLVEDLREVNERLLLGSLREQALRERAEEANDAKSTLLAMMSHELRTPLTAIIGYEELLADGVTGPVSEAQRSQLTRIKASATHLLTLIDQVLSLARIEAGREAVKCEPFDVDALMRTAAELVAPLVAAKSLTCAFQTPSYPLSLNSDRVKVRQIVVNLVANAVKFTDRGEITLAVRRNGDTVTFEVRDTGIGIAAENLERIFDAFWQVQQKATRRVGGTGLGLHVSRRLARLLGGDITVESAPGRGSTFVLALPMEFPTGANEGS